MYFKELDDYKWFENRYLFRILFTLTIILMISSESGSNSFKRTIRYMIYCSLFGEILSFLLRIFEIDSSNKSEHAKYEVIVHKLFVDLVFMTFNCSVCYAMAMSLQLNKSILLKIWYAAIGLTLIYLIFHTFLKHNFGRVNYLIYAAISIYSLKLLFQIKNKYHMLFDGNIPSFITRLIKLEYCILIFSLIVYPISVCQEQMSSQYRDTILLKYDLLLYIMDQCRVTISTSFLLKMYTFIIEWGGNRSQTVHNDEAHALIPTKS